MFHFQLPVPDWPRAAIKLPAGYIIKAIDNVQMLDEGKRVNPGLLTNLRHFYEQQVPAGTIDENIPVARTFFNTFIDGTFMNYAHNVDYVEEWNEYFGNSQSQEEKQRFINWSIACAKVWAYEYRTRPGLEHIKLILANTAIGNDIPLATAQAAQAYDAVLGYHPYWPVKDNIVLPDEWQWYSGRWTAMDAGYRNAGVTVEWAFTEAGSVRYFVHPDGVIGLDPFGGWRHPNVHNASIEQYLTKIKRWMELWHQWNKAHGNRALPPVLYNSNMGGGSWQHFNLVQPQLDIIANFVSQWVPSPPVPPTPTCTGEPREQYFRVYNVIPPDITEAKAVEIFKEARKNSLETVGWSYDDAGIGKLDHKIARLWGIPDHRKQEFIDWYITNYPCTTVEFKKLPL